MSRIALLGMALALTTMVVACGGDDDGLSVDATGSVLGLVWLDRNGNARLDGNDGPVRDVRVQLVPATSGATVGSPAYSAESVEGGEFAIRDVLVGDYRVVVDMQTVGDTLRLLRVDSARVTVEANDTSVVTVGLTYPAVPIDSARMASLDTRLFVEGLVLTRWGTFGEASLHVRDSTGAIKAVRVQQVNVVPGDSVRLLGVTSVQTGQPVIKDALVFLLETGVESPPPDTIATATAATAGDGALDADLVRIEGAEVQDTTWTPAGELALTVDDGSGPVDVVLRFNVPFPAGEDGQPRIIGAEMDVTGVLLPSTSATGTWIIRPREPADVSTR